MMPSRWVVSITTAITLIGDPHTTRYSKSARNHSLLIEERATSGTGCSGPNGSSSLYQMIHEFGENLRIVAYRPPGAETW